MSLLRVIRPGLAGTLQDLGRVGYRALGVPVAGAMDPLALQLANALVGNRRDEACVEILALGPSLEVEADSVRVAVCGCVRLTLGRDGADRPLEPERSHILRRGDRLEIGPVLGAAVAYLAVGGGFALDPVLGSLSTSVKGAIGPLGGRALAAGSVLPLKAPRADDGGDLALAAPFTYGDGPLRVILGPQAGHFTPEAVATFLSVPYRVGKDCDRMGLRLEGPILTHAGGAGIVSDGLVAGCIQVPGNGQPILLLADHQTVGGYAKIATVISADLPRAARAVPGQVFTFQAVTLDQARLARQELDRRLQAALARLCLIGPGVDLSALYSANLVSGMVDAVDGD